MQSAVQSVVSCVYVSISLAYPVQCGSCLCVDTNIFYLVITFHFPMCVGILTVCSFRNKSINYQFGKRNKQNAIRAFGKRLTVGIERNQCKVFEVEEKANGGKNG